MPNLRMADGTTQTFSKVTTKTYNVEPTVNNTIADVTSNVFDAWAELDISSDVSLYGTPIAVCAQGYGGIPVPAKFSASRVHALQYYSRRTSVFITVTFAK